MTHRRQPAAAGVRAGKAGALRVLLALAAVVVAMISCSQVIVPGQVAGADPRPPAAPIETALPR